MRGGTVKAVWNSSTAGYTDFSTTDIGGSTSDISFTVTVINAGVDVAFNAVATSGTWSVKTGVKIIF